MIPRISNRIHAWKLSPLLIQSSTKTTSSFPSSRSSSTSTSSPTTASFQSTHCPSCYVPLPSLLPLCPSCHALLPPPPPATSYFTLFSFSPTQYALDTKELKNRFRELQQKVHPDLYVGQGQGEEWARKWSREVNEGFKVLEGDRSRGEYLVSPLRGVDFVDVWVDVERGVEVRN